MEDESKRVVKNNNDDAVVKSESSQIVNRIVQSVETMTLRLKRRRDKLRRVLTENEDIEEIIDDFADRIKKIEKQQEQQRPISATFEVVKKQHSSSEVILSDVKELQPEFKNLERRVNEFLDRDIPQKEKDSVVQLFEKLKTRWENVEDDSKERVKKTAEVERPSDVYNTKSNEIITWLNDVEKKVPDDDTESMQNVKKQKDTLEV